MSLLVIFPVGKEAAADTYLAFCNANNPDIEPGSIWYQPDRVDRWNQRVVGYLGPGGQWNGGDWPEPEGGEAARVDGVLSATVEWPIVED